MRRETPEGLVKKWEKLLPGAWEQLERMEQARETIGWPDWCRLPINAAYTLITEMGTMNPAEFAAELTACYLWRRCRVIYRFDRDFAALLCSQAEEMSDTDILPAELLLHPPYPATYIDYPGILEHTKGFWYWPDYDTNEGTAELRVQWRVDDVFTLPQVMHIIPGGTLRQCVDATIERTRENLREPTLVPTAPAVEIAGAILKALQLVLYLSAQNCEAREEPRPRLPRRKAPDLHLAPKRPEVQTFAVGVRIGAAIRQNRAVRPGAAPGGTGGKKRPHARRGHWRHVWHGSKDNRRAVLRWIAPMFIHADEAGEEIVIRPVRKPEEK